MEAVVRTNGADCRSKIFTVYDLPVFSMSFYIYYQMESIMEMLPKYIINGF